MQDSGWDNDCLGSCDPKLTAQKPEVKDSCSLSEGSLEFVPEVPGAPHLRVVGDCTPSLRKSGGSSQELWWGLCGGFIPLNPKAGPAAFPKSNQGCLGSQEALLRSFVQERES